MSEENNNEQKFDAASTQPIKKTSAVPLRKETVRVTLKAPGARPGVAPAAIEPAAVPPPTLNLGPGAPALKDQHASPTAKLTPPSTMSLSQPATSKLDIPDVTSAVPLKQETMRVTLKADRGGAPAAPTIPLGGLARPASAVSPAPTMRLGGAPTVALQTQPLTRSVASQPLPKATVELQKTQQLTQGLGGPSQQATIKTAYDEVGPRGGAGPALPLSIISFVLSLVVLYFQFTQAKIWVDEHKGGDIGAIFEGVE